MRFNIISLFPECFLNEKNEITGTLSVGLIGKAYGSKWFLHVDDLKKYSTHLCRMDDRPCGGGPGMIFKPDKLSECLEKYKHKKIFVLSPRGKTLNQEKIKDLIVNYEEITFLSGRYETIDQRLIDYYNMEEISIGDYILCGGEVAIQVIMEGIIRLLPDVMNNDDSGEEESFSSMLLEHDQYTQPKQWNGLYVPDVLFTGDHNKINQWRIINSIEKTFKVRKDLYNKFTVIVLETIILKYMSKNNKMKRFIFSL